MKINKLLLLLTIIVSSFFNSSFALTIENIDFKCETEEHKKVALFYANGMLNNVRDRDSSLSDLYLKTLLIYRSETISGIYKDDIKYLMPKLAINKSEAKETVEENDPWYIYYTYGFFGILAEGFEVAIDYSQELFSASIDHLLGKEVDYLPETMAPAYKAFATSVLNYTDDDLSLQINQYKDYLESKNYKVITVAHSHGNLLTKKVYDYYLSKTQGVENNFKILSVGSPIKMSMASDFILDTKDPIGYLSWTFDWRDKVSNSSTYDDGSYHSFLTYLNGSDSSSRIDDFLKDSLESFDFSTSLFGKDLITLELDKSFSKNQNLKLHVVESSNLLNNNENYYIGNDAEKASTDIGDSLIYGSGYGKFSSDNNSDKYTLSCDAIKNIAGDKDLGNGSIFTVNAYITNFNESKVSTKLTYTAPIVNTSGESKVSAYYDVYPDGNGNYNDSHDNYGYIHIYSSYGEKINYINRLNRSNIEPYEVK